MVIMCNSKMFMLYIPLVPAAHDETADQEHNKKQASDDPSQSLGSHHPPFSIQ